MDDRHGSSPGPEPSSAQERGLGGEVTVREGRVAASVSGEIRNPTVRRVFGWRRRDA